jgi:hypothetical protein
MIRGGQRGGSAKGPLVLVLGCLACRRAPPVIGDAAVSAPEEAAIHEAGPPPPRCEQSASVSLGSAAAQDLDLGEAVFAIEAAWVPFVRMVDGARRASVARVGVATGAAKVMDLGTASGNASTPVLLVRDSEVFALGCVRPSPGDAGPTRNEAGRWNVFRLSGDTAESILVLAETGADAPSLSVGSAPSGSPFGAAVAWDEDRAPAARPGPSRAAAANDGKDLARGVVRLALLSPDLRAVLRLDTVSPETSDAEGPKVLARDGGFWIGWIARRAEPILGDSDAELEAPGEARVFRWVEVMALDAQGKPAGPVRRLTPSLGHVSGFEMASSPASPRLDVYAAQSDERESGAGGSIVHAALTPDGPPRVAPLVIEGVARGGSLWIDRSSSKPSALFYVDVTDHLRILSLNADGDGSGSASLEPALDDTRVLAVRRAKEGIVGLAASAPSKPSDPSSPPLPLRWFSCADSVERR